MFKKNTKKITLLLLVLVVAVVAVSCSGKDKGKDEVAVVKVNGEGVSFEDFKDEYKAYQTLYESQFGEDALLEKDEEGVTVAETLRDDILDKVILEEIVRQDAKKDGIEIDKKEVEENYNEIIQSLGGKEKYAEFLSKSGFSDDYFKKNIKNELLFFKYKDEYIKNNQINEEESKAYFEENKDLLTVAKASHILVNSEEDGKEILEKLEAGEDFKTLAQEHSLDTASGSMGGDLGYFGKTEMIPEFSNAVFNMEKGEISDLVKSDVGYHIIYLEDIKQTYEDLKEEIDYMLNEEKFASHLSELKESATVEIDEEVLNSFDLFLEPEENQEESIEDSKNENKDVKEEESKDEKKDDKKDN